MASRAFLSGILSAANVRLGQKLFDGLLRRGLGRFLAGGMLRNDDVVSGLGRLLRSEDRAGGDVNAQYGKAGAENGTQNLVHLEGVHRLKAPRAWRLKTAAGGPPGITAAHK
jgi:hypothetical protein